MREGRLCRRVRCRGQRADRLVVGGGGIERRAVARGDRGRVPGVYRDEPAVTDRDLITASATAPVDFARAILARLEVLEPHVLDSWYKLYGRQDPAGFHELMAVR